MPSDQHSGALVHPAEVYVGRNANAPGAVEGTGHRRNMVVVDPRSGIEARVERIWGLAQIGHGNVRRQQAVYGMLYSGRVQRCRDIEMSALAPSVNTGVGPS